MRLSTIPSGLATLDGAATGQLLVVRSVLADDDGRRAPRSKLEGQTVRCREVRPDAVRIELAGGCTVEVPMSSARRIQVEHLGIGAAADAIGAGARSVSSAPPRRRDAGSPVTPDAPGKPDVAAERPAEPRRLARPAEHPRLAPSRERRRPRGARASRAPAGTPGGEPRR